MKKHKKNGHHSLIRQIFLSLLGVAFAAVILYGFFLIDQKLDDYKTEVNTLKSSFSETGTGFYEDDVNDLIDVKQKALFTALRNDLLNISGYLLFSVLLSYFLARYFSKRIEKNISLFKDFFKKASTEDQLIDQSKINYKEFVSIAEQANLMVEERKIAEKKLHDLHINLEKIVEERTLKLEATNKELKSFSYSISHDLRAPLRAILGFSQILSGRHRESLNEEGRQYMDYIVEASNRMEQLINDLLSYSRLGRKTVHLDYVNLNELFEGVFMMFKTDLENIGADFIIENEIEDIISDKTLLPHIFTNLVSNAIIYRRENVPLIIKIGCNFKDEFHILYITDNGIGIQENFREKIFDVFQRLHSEETHPGTGIGLASVRKAVTLLGGVVWVESEINEGSTFYIKLPVIKYLD